METIAEYLGSPILTNLLLGFLILMVGGGANGVERSVKALHESVDEPLRDIRSDVADIEANAFLIADALKDIEGHATAFRVRRTGRGKVPFAIRS